MNTELRNNYETYIVKFIDNICENSSDREKLFSLWKKISSSEIGEEIDTINISSGGCSALVKSGVRKGQICGIQCAGEFCRRHEKKSPAADKKICEFILKNGQNCKKYAKEENVYCVTHIAAAEKSSPENKLENEIAPGLIFKEDDLSDASLYTKYRNGYIHNQTNFYLKINKSAGEYKVYGVVQNGNLMFINDDERILTGINYNH